MSLDVSIPSKTVAGRVYSVQVEGAVARCQCPGYTYRATCVHCDEALVLVAAMAGASAEPEYTEADALAGDWFSPVATPVPEYTEADARRAEVDRISPKYSEAEKEQIMAVMVWLLAHPVHYAPLCWLARNDPPGANPGVVPITVGAIQRYLAQATAVYCHMCERIIIRYPDRDFRWPEFDLHDHFSPTNPPPLPQRPAPAPPPPTPAPAKGARRPIRFVEL